ncbi:MAG: hypothetical protein WEB03_11125 [Nitriliruptor sp.]|uniref:hypothetical protein n=1 Tax=Nitriliruptor sp. TaxID=2448056 RepID=UPI0034A0A02A
MAEQERELDLDAAVSRLEDVLLALPVHRALPDLDQLLARAGVPRELLHRDDRALKVLTEAVLARPLADVDAVGQVRTEVELLALEVEVLGDRLADPATTAVEVERAAARLADVRHRLEQLRDQL